MQEAGSSPRAWGTRAARSNAAARHRFIPTCVGNTAVPERSDAPGPVHPHVRGEHIRTVNTVTMTVGSSPRAWGTHLGPVFGLRRRRFIPTCVGNTSRRFPLPSCLSVHPHVRGEHISQPSMIPASPGSSPRAWGTLREMQAQNLFARFIPTCVGNTTAQARPLRRQPVHPHVRGEHSRTLVLPYPMRGSSPRAWGTRLFRQSLKCPPRFIPTCVGNTRHRLPHHRVGAVHPHVRGEHTSIESFTSARRGSSPRAWGTPE